MAGTNFGQIWGLGRFECCKGKKVSQAHLPLFSGQRMGDSMGGEGLHLQIWGAPSLTQMFCQTLDARQRAF